MKNTKPKLHLSLLLAASLVGFAQADVTLQYDFRQETGGWTLNGNSTVPGNTHYIKQDEAVKFKVIGINPDAYELTVTTTKATVIPGSSPLDDLRALLIGNIAPAEATSFMSSSDTAKTLGAWAKHLDNVGENLGMEKNALIRYGRRDYHHQLLIKYGYAINSSKIESDLLQPLKDLIQRFSGSGDSLTPARLNEYIAANKVVADKIRTGIGQPDQQDQSALTKLFTEALAKYGAIEKTLTQALDPQTMSLTTADRTFDQDTVYTITIKPKSVLVTDPVTVGPINFTFRYKKSASNYSLGLGYDALNPGRYKTTGTGANARFIADVEDSGNLSVIGLYHVALGSLDGGGFALSIGAGLESDGMRQYVGISYLLGERNAGVITIGLAFGIVDRLPHGLIAQDYVGKTIPTESVLRERLFIGLTFRQ